MKVLAVIINIFFPGIGTFFVGKIGQAIAQIVLSLIAAVLIFTGIGSLIGIPLLIGVWIWALVTAATSPPQPIQVTVQQEPLNTMEG